LPTVNWAAKTIYSGSSPDETTRFYGGIGKRTCMLNKKGYKKPEKFKAKSLFVKAKSLKFIQIKD